MDNTSLIDRVFRWVHICMKNNTTNAQSTFSSLSISPGIACRVHRPFYYRFQTFRINLVHSWFALLFTMTVFEQDPQIARLRAGVGSLTCAGRVCTSPHVTVTRGRLCDLFFVQRFRLIQRLSLQHRINTTHAEYIRTTITRNTDHMFDLLV